MRDSAPVKPACVAAGLFVAWTIHDLEEAVTMPATSKLLATQLEKTQWAPAVALAGHVRTTAKESALAILLMGTLVAGAAAHGAATGGRSPFFQYVLAGLHGHVYTHIATSLRLRGYSTGLVTAMAVMLPYSLYARRVLRANGSLIEGPYPYVLGGVLLLPSTFACHILARRLIGRDFQ
ncbi:HXXEE domain-containing protein [Arthrobacter sp. AFG7.2]|uniref:HXXEE domain-containing protein n=1 Tax=Arthrobacter sp. AFG7.2 TaxID=1688693 RepID=UPI0011AF2918|nr:HXXEE domain-containing protein [Arthrobacter sp. AFG7.2]